MRFVFLRQAFLSVVSSRPHLTMIALAVQLTVPVIRVRRGLSPPSECALPGAHKRSRIPSDTAQTLTGPSRDSLAPELLRWGSAEFAPQKHNRWPEQQEEPGGHNRADKPV